MNLTELNARIERTENLLQNTSAIEAYVEKNDFTNLIVMVIEQIENILARTVLSIDNFLIVDGEEISVAEGELKLVYLDLIINHATTFNLTDKITPLLSYKEMLSNLLEAKKNTIIVPTLKEVTN